MSVYDELSRNLDAAEHSMREAENRLGTMTGLRPVLADLVGHAETADGHVAVDWTPRGLASLTIDPRAMRLGSADLAEAISQAIRDAGLDLRERTRAAISAAGLTPPATPSMAEAQEQLARVREMTMEGARRSAADLGRAEQLRRRSGR